MSPFSHTILGHVCFICLLNVFSFCYNNRIAIIIIIITTIAASEVSSDTIFNDSQTTRAPADGKNLVPADIIGSQMKKKFCAG